MSKFSKFAKGFLLGVLILLGILFPLAVVDVYILEISTETLEWIGRISTICVVIGFQQKYKLPPVWILVAFLMMGGYILPFMLGAAYSDKGTINDKNKHR